MPLDQEYRRITPRLIVVALIALVGRGESMEWITIGVSWCHSPDVGPRGDRHPQEVEQKASSYG